MDLFVAYCDGSYQSSIDSGGWASIILKDDKIFKKLYQGYKSTTNNRQELYAVLGTLEFFKEPTRLIIYSDSQYVVNSINNKHVYKWFEDGDFSKKNLDLWFKIIDLLNFHTVTFKWVKGHENNEFNELADKHAVHAAQCLNLKKDEINSTEIYTSGKSLVS